MSLTLFRKAAKECTGGVYKRLIKSVRSAKSLKASESLRSSLKLQSQSSQSLRSVKSQSVSAATVDPLRVCGVDLYPLSDLTKPKRPRVVGFWALALARGL